MTAKAGVKGSGWSSSAAWLDYDRDGYLDLFVDRYVDYDIKTAPYCGYQKPGYRMYCDPLQFDGVTPLLFHNNHDGTFTEVSAKPAWPTLRPKAWAWPSATSMATAGPTSSSPTTASRNFLFHNKGNGTFQDVTYTAGTGFDMNGKAMAGMGTEIADFDGDGSAGHLLHRLFARVQHALPQSRQTAVRGRDVESRTAIGDI